MILKLDFESEIPIYIQLRNQIVVAIAHGYLSQGEKLPTIRNLAEDLGINNMTVNKAYAMLKQEGFISIDRRHGAKVNPILTPDFKFKEKLEDDLTLVISEAEIRGMKKDEFMKICENIFDSMKGGNPYVI
ncbi:GntR family transcriptional regulator [Intestinibacter sp.]|uniref:GntR family transcriptional regulator n=1 Tax=Intestinibacter sp. TaxID=1965304 RepID=UPI00307D11E6